MSAQATSTASAPLCRFPDGFLWGAVNAAYSVEGANYGTDWWRWEQRPGRIHDGATSQSAAGHYERFREDFQQARRFGHTVHAFSIEWSRVEPTEGTFDSGALAHYRAMAEAAREAGLRPIAVLWHWSLPQWFAANGGWLRRDGAARFERYVAAVVEAVGDRVTDWVPLFQPERWVWQAYVEGAWPPAHRSAPRAYRVFRRLARVHCRAYAAIKAQLTNARVGLSVLGRAYEPADANREWDVRLARRLTAVLNHGLLQQTARMVSRGPAPFDFIGVGYEGTQRVSFAITAVRRGCVHWGPEGTEASLDGDALRDLLESYRHWERPLLVLGDSCGAPDVRDRCSCLAVHLRAVAEAIEAGLPIEAYLVRSLLDGFEWDAGYGARYGLLHVARDTQARTPNAVAFMLKAVSEANALTPATVSRYAGAEPAARLDVGDS